MISRHNRRCWAAKLPGLLLLAWSVLCQAQEVEVGSYIVVRGAVQGCEQWTGRILEVVKVEPSQPVPLLGLPPLDYVGLSAEEISLVLQAKIESLTGYRPRTVWVEVLATDDEYRRIRTDYQSSVHYLSEGRCPNVSDREPGILRDGQTPPSLNEEMRRAYRLDLYERVVRGVVGPKQSALPQIRVTAVQPVLARRAEDVDVHCVLEGDGAVRQV